MQTQLQHCPAKITSESSCVGHCTTMLGDEACRSCHRTFDEITRWVGMSEEERRAVNRRIALEYRQHSAS